MARVFITRRLPGDPQERIAREGHEVDVWEGDLPPSREELLARADGAEGLITLLTERVDGDLLDALPGLKVVSNYAVGSDNIDLEAAAERGIPVGVTPDVLTEATADLAWALMLAVARGIVPAAADVRAGNWQTWEPQGWIGHDVYGATLLVVGAGRIGQAVAKRGAGFAMRSRSPTSVTTC
jgi:glyoxylate reductase